VEVSFLAFAGALLLGLLGATARRSGVWPLRLLGTVYVEAIRNTPALVQIFLVYFGLPFFGIHLPAFVAGTVALAINAGAYLTETIRAGLQSVAPGQFEAARTLGLPRASIFAHVVLPQAVRVVYPPVVNEFMQVILGSSLLSTIALNDITGAALTINGLTFETINAFSVALVLYLLLTSLVSLGASFVARTVFRPPLPRIRRARTAVRVWPLSTTGGAR
jgi:polar amino acid transport system permease protein